MEYKSKYIYVYLIRPPRALHYSCLNNKKLYIFGGINSKGFCSLDLFVIETGI